MAAEERWEDWAVDVSDAELVAGWRAGDMSSAAMLFARHRAALRAVAVAMLGPGAEAEDAAQDAVLIALSRPDALRDPAAVSAWLRGITRNVCRRRWRQALAMTDATGDRARELFGDPAAALDALATRDWVWASLGALSPALRHATVLRYFSDARSYQAIAAVLGVPVGTVRSRLSEARRILASSLMTLVDDAHADHAMAAKERAALFEAIYHEYNRGLDCSVLRTALLPEAELRAADVAIQRGRERIVRDIESDVEAGVRLEIIDIVVGPDITVVEGAFCNPAGDLDHCPPVTTQVFLHRGSAIGSIGLHYGPRPIAYGTHVADA